MTDCIWCKNFRACGEFHEYWEKVKAISLDGEKRHQLILEKFGNCEDFEEGSIED